MICLYEGTDKTGKNLVFRTPYMQQCIVETPKIKTSNLQKIKIVDANKSCLHGEISE